MGRPAAAIPARWHAVRFAVGQLHHARLGVTAKTLSNHRANLKAALRWFGNEQGVPQKGTRLSPDWAWFRDRLDDRLRARLYSLMRYCSARGIHNHSCRAVFCRPVYIVGIHAHLFLILVLLRSL
jgi:hypothetical protein